MSLTFYGHPLASYCHKVLIALYEIGVPFSFHQIDLGDSEDRALMAKLSPMGKMPALRDDFRGVTVSESSMVIEYLDRHYPGPHPLLPPDPDEALVARQWDRIFDFHIGGAMQQIVDARLFIDPATEAAITPYVQSQLDRAYAAADRHLQGRHWVTDAFGQPECAAAPALFYAGILHPFDDHHNLVGYFERLLERPSVARVLEEAKPWFQYYPFLDRMPARFR